MDYLQTNSDYVREHMKLVLDQNAELTASVVLAQDNAAMEKTRNDNLEQQVNTLTEQVRQSATLQARCSEYVKEINQHRLDHNTRTRRIKEMVDQSVVDKAEKEIAELRQANADLSAANTQWENDNRKLRESGSTTADNDAPTQSEDSPCAECARAVPPPCTQERFEELESSEAAVRRFNMKDLLAKAAKFDQSEADKNAAVAEHALLMSAATRHDVHATALYRKLRLEYQQILSFLPSTTNVAIENIRPLSSFVEEVMFEDAALLSQRQSPTQDDNSDAANTKGSSV